ncbi:MAG: hypothetical protein EBR82_18290 [Caulobacteraceae bacterium]|nr:hypothetical protein [Caulobacteraceae bacterium]
MTFQMTLTGMKPLVNALRQLPFAMQVRVIVPAVTKGAKTIERAIAPLIPVNSKKMRRNGLGKLRHSGHYRNMLTSVVRQYPATDSVVGVIGAESGKAPHSILVESGTRQRFTNSKPTYRRMATSVKTVIKNGRPVTKVVRQKQSTGSVIRRKNKPQHNRGIMPAFHPVQRGVAAAASGIGTQLAADIASGITRELTAAKLGGGP